MKKALPSGMGGTFSLRLGSESLCGRGTTGSSGSSSSSSPAQRPSHPQVMPSYTLSTKTQNGFFTWLVSGGVGVPLIKTLQWDLCRWHHLVGDIILTETLYPSQQNIHLDPSINWQTITPRHQWGICSNYLKWTAMPVDNVLDLHCEDKCESAWGNVSKWALSSFREVITSKILPMSILT